MRKLNILILWVSLSGDESIAVYQDAVQKGKWTRLLERIHGQSPRIFFFFFFRFLPKWTPEKNMSPGWAALGPFLRVLATVPWALRAWLVRRGMGAEDVWENSEWKAIISSARWRWSLSSALTTGCCTPFPTLGSGFPHLRNENRGRGTMVTWKLMDRTYNHKVRNRHAEV